jgi:hypothetical protein
MSNEALEIISMIEDTLTSYQMSVNNGLGQDLEMFICLGNLLYLGRLDREFLLVRDGK